MASTGITDAELEQLAKEFAELRDEAIARVNYSPNELHELAERHRRLAKLSDSEGQRRALIVAAERYELEAQNPRMRKSGAAARSMRLVPARVPAPRLQVHR